MAARLVFNLVSIMRPLILASLGAAVLSSGIGISRCAGQETPSTSPSDEAAAGLHDAAADLAAIRAGAEAFVAAFNKGDAGAVAALWTEDGEYVDDSGRAFSGRAAIEQGYAQFFDDNPDSRIRVVVDSARLLSDTTAVEDGRAILEPAPGGAPGVGSYTAIHVKIDGKWLMASVRDSRVDSPSTHDHVADLEWLIGVWDAEEHGVRTESVCTWTANKSFVRRDYTVTHVDGATMSGLQVIGWDAEAGHVQSWDFSPGGGHAVGVWTPHEGGWTSQTRGVTGDGVVTTSVNMLTRLDDDAYVWQSVQRTAGGAALADTGEVILTRRQSSQ